MKKTEKEKLFDKYIRKWIKKTYLGWWHIDVVYYNSYDFSKECDPSSIDVVGICFTSWIYMTATIKVNSEKLEKLSDEEIETSALHELMHVILNEMREDGIEHEERVATFLERSFRLAEK